MFLLFPPCKNILSNLCTFFFTGNHEAALELRKELATLRQRVEQLEMELKTKDDEIKRLSSKSGNSGHDERCKVRFFSNFHKIEQEKAHETFLNFRSVKFILRIHFLVDSISLYFKKKNFIQNVHFTVNFSFFRIYCKKMLNFKQPYHLPKHN